MESAGQLQWTKGFPPDRREYGAVSGAGRTSPADHAESDEAPRRSSAPPATLNALRTNATSRSDGCPPSASRRASRRAPGSLQAVAARTQARSTTTGRATGRRRRRSESPPVAQKLQRVAHCNGKGPGIDGFVRCLLSESATCSARRLGGSSAANTSSMTSSSDRLVPRDRDRAPLGRPRRKDCQAQRARMLTPAPQSVDFPIPASPSSTRAAALPPLLDESVDGGEFRLAADDLENHVLTMVTEVATKATPPR